MTMTSSVILFHFDGAGVNTDYSGDSNTEVTGAAGVTRSVTGVLGLANSFNGGSTAGFEIADSVTTNNLTHFKRTIMFWFKPAAVNVLQVLFQDGSTTMGEAMEVTASGALAAGTWRSATLNSWGLNSGLNSGTWYHAAFVQDGTTSTAYAANLNKLYVNGAQAASFGGAQITAGTGDTRFGGNNGARHADNTASGTNAAPVNGFNGTMDEFVMFNRALTATEVADAYKRGALSLRYRVRSGTANPPSGSFLGPDGTTATYYDETGNGTTGMPSLSLTNVSNNRYFQYEANFATVNTGYTPELKSVTIGPTHYPGDNPTISNNTPVTFAEFSAFSQTLGGGNAGTIEYTISHNNTTFYYWNGSNWVTSSGSFPTQTSTAAEVNTNAAQFDNDVASGSFYFKAYLNSANASQTVELDQLDLTYISTFPGPPSTPVNSLPASGATAQVLNPTLTASAYSDPNSDAHQDTNWQLDNNSDFSSPEWTRTAGAAETSKAVNSTNGTFANSLSGKTALDHNTVYYFRVRYQDATSSWSSYSTGTSFTTNTVATPTNSTPTDAATVGTLTPTLTSAAFSDAEGGHTHLKSQWVVDDNSDFSSITYDSGESNDLASHVIGSSLSNSTTYYWKVRHKDSTSQWSAYSTYTSFSITLAPPNTPTNSTPADAATNQNLNPGLTASAYSDPATVPQQDANWQVDDNNDFSSPEWTRTAGAAEVSTTVNSSNGTFANNLSGKTELAHNTVYYFRVRYQNTGSVWSSYSTGTSFTTNIITTPSNSTPANTGTVTTPTPTLTSSAFSDAQGGHTHAKSQWLVDDNSDFSSVTDDSGESTDLTSHVVATTLTNSTVYYWKVRY
jgi:hypothetical protein